jgi:hypothetical protein
MEGLHTIGDILTKISVNCVINLHVALLFTCYFYRFILCMIIVVCMLMGISCIYCMYIFTSFQCESMHLHSVFVYSCFIYIKIPQEFYVCICFNCMQL